jgi:hypothetical protein
MEVAPFDGDAHTGPLRNYNERHRKSGLAAA